MMINKRESAFRQALEQRLRTIHYKDKIPLSRLRKTIAFDRFLARLLQINPDKWILKGGLSLELRLGQQARTTKDMDLLSFSQPEEVYGLLFISGKLNLDDYFEFQVNKPINEAFETTAGTRYSINCLVDGRLFEQFHVDIGVNDKLLEPYELLKMPSYLDFAKIDSTKVPCYSINQQIAEKLHAMTKPYKSGESSRAKDLVDILILASFSPLNLNKLKHVVFSTFSNRNTHPLPNCVSILNPSHQKTFINLSNQVNLRFKQIEEANNAINVLLSPIFADEKNMKWDPIKFIWD